MTCAYLQHNWSDQTLDFGGFEPLLLAFLLGEWTLNYVSSYIILLIQVKQLPDLGGSLGSQTTGNLDVGESRNLLFNEKEKTHFSGCTELD